MNLADAGFVNDAVPETEAEAAATKKESVIPLSEVKQLLIPMEAEMPESLAALVFTATDLVELGHVIYDAEVRGMQTYFLRIANDVALVALQYPTMFRLSAAVVQAIPNVDYPPRFNQAVFGCPTVSWGYIVDSLGLNDELRFDTQAQVTRDLPINEEDDNEIDAAPSGD